MDFNIFKKVSYGLYVVTSIREGKINGQIANTFFQITSDPVLVAIGINKSNLTHAYIKSSGIFAVSILPQSVPLDLIGHFGFKSGREIDKFASVPFEAGETGAPYLLENSIGYLEAQVVESFDAGTHSVFMARVVNTAVFSNEEPITYADYHYRKRSTGAGPSQQGKPDGGRGGRPLDQKYQCLICGYVYDPAAGDPETGIMPGTAFADIPDDWVCPICGVGKDQFEPIT